MFTNNNNNNNNNNKLNEKYYKNLKIKLLYAAGCDTGDATVSAGEVVERVELCFDESDLCEDDNDEYGQGRTSNKEYAEAKCKQWAQQHQQDQVSRDFLDVLKHLRSYVYLRT